MQDILCSPIRRLPDGTIETDTVVEMLDYEAKNPVSALILSTRQGQRVPSEPIVGPRQAVAAPPEATWVAFCNKLRGPKQARQRKILAIVKGRGTAGITLDELCTAIGEKDPVMVGRTLGAIKKNARSVGYLQPEKIITPRDSQTEYGRYKAGSILLENDPPTP